MSSSFEDLIVWQKGHLFVLEVYRVTKGFPKEELFGLTSQFRRAAVSITANIAEGFQKIGKKDKLRFYNVAQGTLNECRNYIILSRDLNYISVDEYQSLNELLIYTSRLLNKYCAGLIENVQDK
jgi:four helix bundle protein